MISVNHEKNLTKKKPGLSISIFDQQESFIRIIPIRGFFGVIEVDR
jgi:hypothetical protein